MNNQLSVFLLFLEMSIYIIPQQYMYNDWQGHQGKKLLKNLWRESVLK
jgi:hypothetical protein